MRYCISMKNSNFDPKTVKEKDMNKVSYSSHEMAQAMVSVMKSMGVSLDPAVKNLRELIKVMPESFFQLMDEELDRRKKAKRIKITSYILLMAISFSSVFFLVRIFITQN